MAPYLENNQQKAKRILQDVIRETEKGEPGYLFTNEKVYSILVKKGFVEVNGEISNDAGELATRATELGLAQKVEPEKEEVVMFEGKSDFEIGNVPEGFTLPESNRGGPRGSKYPFYKMEVNNSFFVPNTAVKGGDAVKTMTGACGKANKHFGKPKVDADNNPVMRGTKNGETQATEFVKIFRVGPYTNDEVEGAMVVRTV